MIANHSHLVYRLGRIPFNNGAGAVMNPREFGWTDQSTSSMPLALANIGERLRIVDVSGQRTTTKRLESMGLRVGVECQIVQRQGNGVVVQVENTRLALGTGLLHRVRVDHV